MTTAPALETFDIDFKTETEQKLAELLFMKKPALGKALQGILGLSMEETMDDFTITSITVTPNVPLAKLGVAFAGAQNNHALAQPQVQKVFDNLYAIYNIVGNKLDKGHLKKASNLTEQGETSLQAALGNAANDTGPAPAAAVMTVVATTASDSEEKLPKRDNFQPLNKRQLLFYDQMDNHDVTFGIGAAGTGKTRVAVEKALYALKTKKVRKVILARPAVEGGESLGFLPGTIKEKLEGFLQPLYDEAIEVLGGKDLKAGKEKLDSLMRDGIVEIVPIGKLRGRTLKHAFVIVDECQNATWTQMKTIITRLGEGSKMAITGDPEQIDLTPKSLTGLEDAISSLEGIPNFGSIRFLPEDIVRHPAVKLAVAAFAAKEDKDQSLTAKKGRHKTPGRGASARH